MINNDAQIVTPTNLFTEIELTDEQLESICGGVDHNDHRGSNNRRNDDSRHPWHRHGHWDRWHHWCWDN